MAYSVEELEVEIAKVTQSVSKVEEEIHALQQQIEEAARKALERGVDQRYWRKTEELLLKEEELLLKQESLHIVRREKLKGFLLAQLAGGSQGAAADYILEKKASILLSNASTRTKDELLQLLCLREEGAPWDY